MSWPAAPRTTVEAYRDVRSAVTVLSGFWPEATLAVARALFTTDPSLILIRHDLSGVRDGLVHRIVRTGTRVLEDDRVTLVHGCVMCTLREDVLPCLVRIARSHPHRDLVLVLPEAVEPQALADACAICRVGGVAVTEHVRFDSFVTVVDAERVLPDLVTTDDLRHRGMHAADDDHRSVANVVARQIEYSDTIVLWGESTTGAFDTARLTVLLHRLAPWAAHVGFGEAADVDYTVLGRRLRRTGRHRSDVPGVLARGIEGYPLGVHEPVPDCGVVSAVFRARRPFHPGRLREVLESVIADSLRSRGHVWLASQPDLAIAWESAGGGLGMGGLGRWLAALPDDRWQGASDRRRLAAAVDWDPYYGDRHNHLVFVGLHLDPADLPHRLAACLLTDAEISLGEERWRAYDDPFAGCFDADDDGGANENQPQHATTDRSN